MTNSQLIRNFLELLDKTGFPEERKKYWLDKIAAEETGPDDEEKLTEELIAHLKTLDEAITFTEAQIAADRQKVDALEAQALPYLQRLAKDQPEYYEQESARYKNDVLSAEKQMMTEVEGIRGAKTTEEIEAIRKKLGAK